MNRFLSRISSNRGDTNTVSQILWIALAVVMIIAIVALIGRAISTKATEVANCIQTSKNFVGANGNWNSTVPTACTGTGR